MKFEIKKLLLAIWLVVLAWAPAWGQQSQLGGRAGSFVMLGATNNTLYVTNNYNISSDTSNGVVVITLAGTTAARGTYTIKSSVGGVTVWTNANGAYGLIDDPSLSFDDEFAITNAAGVEYYYAAVLIGGTWSKAAAGANPVPASNYGPTTNYHLEVISTPVSLPVPVTQSNIIYVRTNGNNYFAQRGRVDAAYSNFWSALAVAQAWDIIDIGPGTFYETNATTTSLPIGLKIRGQGQRVTTLKAVTVGSSALNLNNSNIVSDLTTDFGLISGGIYNATNTTVLRVEGFGTSDVWVGNRARGVKIIDCDFYCTSDCVADLESTGPTWPIIEIINTRLYADNLGVNNSCHGINHSGNSQIVISGGSISAINSATCAAIWASSSPVGGGGSITWNGTVLLSSTTNSGGVAYDLFNESGTKTRLVGRGQSFSNYTTAATSRTMNTWAGKVKLASGSQTYTVTDNLVASTSLILASVATDDATILSVKAIPGSGSFTLKCNGNAAANCDISWWLMNQ